MSTQLPHAASLASIPIKHEDRWIIFPPGTPYHHPPPPLPPYSPPPPPPPPPSSSFIAELRLTHPRASSSELNIVAHPLIPGVYTSSDGNYLFTKNLVPGVQSLDDYEDVVVRVPDDDGVMVEYREWSPYESKLAAAILSGVQSIWIEPRSRVLVLFSRDDEQFGITISHISDIVGAQGMVYVVEPSNCKTLLKLADKRFNILPIVDNHMPCRYRMLINMVDVIFAALDCAEEAHMVQLNAKYFLITGGHYMLYVQANCIESVNGDTNRGDAVFSSRAKGERVQFKRIEQVTLKPFDRDHAYVSGVFRTLEIADIDSSCLVSRTFWTKQDPLRDDGRHVCLWEKQKNLPVFMLFESACGYALFRAHDMYKVERNYIAIEEYINRFDEVFEFIACHTFESTDDALMYLTADCNGTVPEKLMEFLVLNLPTAMENDEHCYSLALPNACISDEIVTTAKISCSANPIHVEVTRGLRMNIDKIFTNMKPRDLERAQLALARIYCTQKLISPDKGKSKKKRCSFKASVPTRRNPKRKARADAKTEFVGQKKRHR